MASAGGPRSSGTGRAARPSRTALRVDAERNRARLIEAARTVFAESGLDAPLEDIAERANVGIATLYRRFPTREELIAATYEAQLAVFAQTVEDALHVPDPWAGFSGCVERLCAMQAENRGFTTLVTIALPDSTEAPRAGAGQARPGRAGAAGAGGGGAARGLRGGGRGADPDGQRGRGRRHGGRRPGAWRRFAAYMIQAFSARGAAPLPEPPTPAAMHQALLHLHRAGIRDQRCGG